jgi:hypothetical protein
MTAEPRVAIGEPAMHLRLAKDSVHRWIESRGLPVHETRRLWKLGLSEVDEKVRTEGTSSVNPKRGDR